MAESYHSVTSVSSTSLSNIILVPTDETLIIKSIRIANTHATTSSAAELYVRKSGAGSDIELVPSKTVTAQDSIELLSQPLVIEEGDVLKWLADSTTLHATVSYLRIF